MGCKKQQMPKSEVSKVEESFAASNSYNIGKMDNSSKASTSTSDEKNEIAAIDNKNQKTEEGIKVQAAENLKPALNTSAGEEKRSNSTVTAVSTKPSISTSKEAAPQPSSPVASQTGAQQNQGSTAGTNQGQTSQTGSVTTPTNGGTAQTGVGTTQPNGGTAQTGGGGTITPGNDPRSEPPKLKPSAPTGDQVVAYASNFLGTPYQFGGTTPDGFDNSGFVQYVFNHFKIEVGRTIYQQYKAGASVLKDQLQPGDIVFFGSEQNPHHVGIYVGNNSFIHVTQTGDVVKISPLTRSDFAGARRVI
jgi:cell wall-associated NlpC family hydrolase